MMIILRRIPKGSGYMQSAWKIVVIEKDRVGTYSFGECEAVAQSVTYTSVEWL